MSREHNTWTKSSFVLCGSNPRQLSFPCFMSVRFNAHLGLRLNQLEYSLASLVAVEFMAVEKRNEWMNEWLNEQAAQQQSTQFSITQDESL